MTETAAAYAASIAEEVRLLDAALGGDVEACAAFPCGDDSDGDDPDTLANYLNGFTLEVVTYHGTNEETIVEVLRTYGGPSCRIVRDSRDGDTVAVRVTWWADASTVTVYAPNVAGALDVLAEELTPAR